MVSLVPQFLSSFEHEKYDFSSYRLFEDQLFDVGLPSIRSLVEDCGKTYGVSCGSVTVVVTPAKE